MGKFIAFWSPYSGSRVTGAVAAVGTCLSMGNPGINIAIVEMPGGNNRLPEFFDENISSEIREEIYEKCGLPTLILLFKGGMLDETSVKACEVPTGNGNLSLFPIGERLKGNNGIREAETGLLLVKNLLREKFDYVLADFGNRCPAPGTADIVICLLPQSEKLWREAANERITGDVYVLNGEVTGSHNCIRTLRNAVSDRVKGENVFSIPFCVKYMDALIDGEAVSFFWKTGASWSKSFARPFLESVGRLSERIRTFR